MTERQRERLMMAADILDYTGSNDWDSILDVVGAWLEFEEGIKRIFGHDVAHEFRWWDDPDPDEAINFLVAVAVMG